VIFLLEDNGYALSVPKQRATSITHHADRARSYGFPGVVVPHGSPEQVYEVMGEAVERARAGGGPTLVEVQIDRMAGGFEGDWQRYRPEDEMELMRERDVVRLFERRLVDRGILDEQTIAAMTEGFGQEFSEAVEFARASEFPAPEEAFKHLFPEQSSVPRPVEVAA
jgi:pyruvate dehydrogenase E1 component alpha subunit